MTDEVIPKIKYKYLNILEPKWTPSYHRFFSFLSLLTKI